MRRIRIGNDFTFVWVIERKGVPEDLEAVQDIALTITNAYGQTSIVEDFVLSTNVLSVDVTPAMANKTGGYKLALTYKLADATLTDSDRLCAVDVDAFIIVSATAEADPDTDLTATSEIGIGLRGLTGAAFTYEDFTPEQLDALKVKGDPFTYEDFTEEQLLALKGGDGRGEVSRELINTVGKTKTYRITYSDNTTLDYDVKDGEAGADGYTPIKDVDYFDGEDGNDGRGEVSRELISTVGLVKTYRITYTDLTTFEYSVSDGAVGKSQYQSYLETTTDDQPLSEAAWGSFLIDLYDLVNILLPENAMITSSGNYVVSKDKKYLITI